MNAISHSSSRLLAARLYGPLTPAAFLSHDHLEFDGYVVSLTRPGSPRMPNGIECTVEMGPRDRAVIGAGRLAIGRLVLTPGPEWDPVPSFDPVPRLPPGPLPPLQAFGQLGPGLLPAADAVLAGYVAGLVLLHGRRTRASRLLYNAASPSVSLSRTLLRHAALGEVPEPVHTLLKTGDVRPLLAFERSTGQALLRGLISAGYTVELESLSLPAASVR